MKKHRLIPTPLIEESAKREVREKFEQVLAATYATEPGDLSNVVRAMFDKRERLLATAQRHGTACYVLDEQELATSLTAFSDAFMRTIPNLTAYFAVKVNDHPDILRAVVRHGYGLDVSSEREFDRALDARAKRIICTGPAKSDGFLERALAHSDRTIVNLDSLRELTRLGMLAERRKIPIHAGMRVVSNATRSWNKFGIPIPDIRRAWDMAKTYPHLTLCGIHTHMSWNKDATPYEDTMHELAAELAHSFTAEERATIQFYDFGGGFVPDRVEGEYPSYPPQGTMIKAIYEHFDEKPPFRIRHYAFRSSSHTEYARGIARSLKQHITPLLPNAHFITEPGRMLVNNAMHVLLRIVDIKENGVVIVDGGMNIIGWERFDLEYFPVLNLTHPSRTEREVTIYGSLCMMQDVWGYYCYASKMEVGDILVVPYQGALTYSLSQDFIHGKPRVVRMR